MQKDQRLLDLAALLLKAAEPVSWREIQEQFADDYAGKGEAAIRKFERDKADLLELGIPVRWVAGDEDLPAGYLIDKDEFYLPDLRLPPEDLALLYLAGSAALAPGGTIPELRQALQNLAELLAVEGATLDDVCKTTLYLVDMNDYAAVNEAWVEYFPAERPTRSAVAVAALPIGARVEVEAWAYAPVA